MNADGILELMMENRISAGYLCDADIALIPAGMDRIPASARESRRLISWRETDKRRKDPEISSFILYSDDPERRQMGRLFRMRDQKSLF